MKRKNLILIILSVVVVLAGYKLYTNKKKINERNQPETEAILSIPVVADSVKLKPLDQSIKKTGSLIPYKEAIIYAATSGNIEQLKFELGSRVNQGQLLAVTDTRKLKLDLQNATANERKLQNDVQTYSELLEGKATTKEKVNQLKIDYSDAANQSAQIRKQLADTRILAPISGIITEKTVESGVFLNSGAKLGTIVDLRKAKVKVFLTENEVYQVKQNDEVEITTDVYPDKMFSGKISFISPQADATHSYLVEIAVENVTDTALRSGTFVYVTFSKKAGNPILVIPREALLENLQIPTVYVIKNNRVQQREIKTGKDSGNFIEVLSGVSQGDVVVTSGQINLKNNALISISNKKAK